MNCDCASAFVPKAAYVAFQSTAMYPGGAMASPSHTSGFMRSTLNPISAVMSEYDGSPGVTEDDTETLVTAPPNEADTDAMLLDASHSLSAASLDMRITGAPGIERE